jgi:hypothetical protein
MKSNYLIASSTKYKLLLVFLAIAGAVFVLLSTRYGVRLYEIDASVYITTGESLITGAGFVRSDGTTPVLHWPPLYPALLALAGVIFGTNPLFLANAVNALVFGLIVYLGGSLTFRHFSSFPILAFLGTLAILFSAPLFEVSTEAWSEPVFILFVLFSLIFAESYLSKNDTTSLILLSLSVALSCLARYVGVTLILWGVLIILISRRNGLKGRIAHLSLFILISALPLWIWLIRNYVVAGTLTDLAAEYRALFVNLSMVFNTLLHWYIPGRIAEHRLIFIFVSAAAGFLAGFILRGGWPSVKVTLHQDNPIVLFVIIYTVFVIITATFTFVYLDSRILSPIYIPLTLLLLITAQAMGEQYRKRFSNKIVNSFLIIGMMIWLVYPIHAIVLDVVHPAQTRSPIVSKAWMESATVRYLLQHPILESEYRIYTNGTDIAYILAHLKTDTSPVWRDYGSPEIAISKLRGFWPGGDKACLVWFNDNIVGLNYFLTFDELKEVADLDLIIQLEDGAIYSVTRK